MFTQDTLAVLLAESKHNKDVSTAMLIEQLLDTYKQLDSERAQKSAVIKSSSLILRDQELKDQVIKSLHESITNQSISVNNAIASFRKIYEMSVYGNSLFKAEPLLRLWLSVEKFIGSTNNEEISKNTVEMMSVIQELSENNTLVDMRNNMVSFTKFINEQSDIDVEDTDRERGNKTTTTINVGDIEESNGTGSP